MKEKILGKIRDTGIGRAAKATILAGSIFEVILGLIMFLFPSASSSLVGYIVGAGFLIYGLFCIISFIIQPLLLFLGVSLFSGLFSVICGILILSYPGAVLTILCIVLGLFIIICGFMLSTLSVTMGAFGNHTWWITMLLSIFFVISGFIILINPGTSSNFIMMFTGAILLIEAATNFLAMYKIKKLREGTQPAQTSVNNAIDADFVDVDD